MLVSVKDAASIYHVHKLTIYRWVKAGHLPAERYGRTIRVRVPDDPASAQVTRAGQPTAEAATTEQTISDQTISGSNGQERPVTRQTISGRKSPKKRAGQTISTAPKVRSNEATKQTISGFDPLVGLKHKHGRERMKHESAPSRNVQRKPRKHVHEKADGNARDHRRR